MCSTPKTGAITQANHPLLAELVERIKQTNRRWNYRAIIAAKAKVSRSCVYDLVGGKRIELETAEKIAAGIGLRLAWMPIEGRDSRATPSN